MKYGTVDQLTDLLSPEMQQLNGLIMNSASGGLGLFASFDGF
jgi:hypothetical protein